MDCKVCGSSEFCTTSGITYCTECNSQIEETQTETNVDFVPGKDILSSSFVKKAAKEDNIEFSDWITAECFNYIIYMQVCALIKLGASPKLKDSVLHIWTKYLQKCEIAFRIDYQAADKTPHLGPAPKVRDVQVLYGDKKIPRPKRKKSRKSSRSVTSGEESNESETDNSGYTSDTASTVSSASSKKKLYSCHTRKLYRKGPLNTSRKSTYSRKVFNMNLQKTLSFCYLGLLYSEDQLSLCDLIRFVYEDKVPYLVINDKLPPFLRFQFTDSSTFVTFDVPAASMIHKTALQIVEFLKLPKFKEPSIHLVVSRYVKDLNLPDDIKPIVRALIESYEVRLSEFKNGLTLKDEPIDYQALCFIIIALKLLFVLDNEFENEHSKSMKKLNAIHPDKNYFVWQDWKEQSMIKEYLFLPKTPGAYMMGKLDRLSSDRMISTYPFTRLKSKDTIPHRTIVGRYDIQNALSNIVNIPEKINILPTSFPLRTEVNRVVQEWNTMGLFKETKEIDFTVLQKDFSSCSLNYDPKQFDKVKEELSYLLMTDLYMPDSSLDNVFSRVPSLHQYTLTKSKYWFMSTSGMQWRSEYSKAWFQKLPSSFKWLMSFIGKYVYCNDAYLYIDVTTVEKALFFQSNQSNKFYVKSAYSKIKDKIVNFLV